MLCRKHWRHIAVAVNITSNTTLITDEVLKFLYDNEFSLTVSLDGDRQAHDKNRVWGTTLKECFLFSM